MKRRRHRFNLQGTQFGISSQCRLQDVRQGHLKPAFPYSPMRKFRESLTHRKSNSLRAPKRCSLSAVAFSHFQGPAAAKEPMSASDAIRSAATPPPKEWPVIQIGFCIAKSVSLVPCPRPCRIRGYPGRFTAQARASRDRKRHIISRGGSKQCIILGLTLSSGTASWRPRAPLVIVKIHARFGRTQESGYWKSD